MPATKRKIELTQKDLEKREFSGGSWSEIEVPGDYEVTLREVADYDKRKEGGSWGWIFTYGIETSTGWCEFDTYLSFSKKARWKLGQVIVAHTGDESARVAEFDPNDYVGSVIGGHVDFPRNREGETTGDYREIQEFFPQTEMPAPPEEDESESSGIRVLAEDVPVL